MKKNVGLTNTASNCYMQLSTSMFMKQKNVVTKTTGKVLNANSTNMFMKQKNVGLANYRVSFKCKQQHTMFMKQQTRDLLLKIAEVV